MAPEDLTRRLDTEDRGTRQVGTPAGDRPVAGVSDAVQHASYDPSLSGIGRRMQDHARSNDDRQLFAVGQLLEHIHHLDAEDKCDSILTALGCSVAFAWLGRTGAI